MEDITSAPPKHKAASLSTTEGASDGAPRHVQLARDYLAARGVTLEAFEQAGNAIIANAHALDPVCPAFPALVFNFHHPVTGEPLTYPDAQGAPRPFRRFKPLGTAGAKFLQPRDSGTHVYFAAHPDADWPAIAADPSYGVVLTEGETRSLAGVTRGLAIISITGVDCGQVNGELHPDLACVEWRDRQVFLAFDSDVRRKPGPEIALQRLAALLRQCGAEVYEVAVPAAPDGSKQGLDDYLARHGADAFKALLTSPETRPYPGLEAYEPPIALADLMAAEYPPTEWVWDKLVLAREPNLLYGDGGCGKSLLALYLQIAVAAGLPLFGSATMQMPCLGLYAEDGPGQVQQRITAILIELGLDHKGALPLKLWCQPHGETLLASIDDNGAVTELPRLRALRAELAAIGRPAFLVLDSLADLFVLNESQRQPVNAAFKQVLGPLCRDYGASVLVLAHPSKASMLDGTHYSGSTAFNAAVRNRLTLETDTTERGEYAEGPPPRRLSTAKHNYGDGGEKRLWYYGTTITELPRVPVGADDRSAKLQQIVVAEAIAAAEHGVPVNLRDAPPPRVFDAAEKALGRRPSKQQVREALRSAAMAGDLIRMGRTEYRAAGFYPPDNERAAELSRQARRAGRLKKEDGDA